MRKLNKSALAHELIEVECITPSYYSYKLGERYKARIDEEIIFVYEDYNTDRRVLLYLAYKNPVLDFQSYFKFVD